MIYENKYISLFNGSICHSISHCPYSLIAVALNDQVKKLLLLDMVSAQTSKTGEFQPNSCSNQILTAKWLDSKASTTDLIAGPVKFSWAAKRLMPRCHLCANASTFLVRKAQAFFCFVWCTIFGNLNVVLPNKFSSHIMHHILGGGCTIDCTTEDRIVCITPRKSIAHETQSCYQHQILTKHEHFFWHENISCGSSRSLLF